MKTWLVCIGVLITVGAQAQRWPSDLWHDGKAVLTTGDTLRGLIKYDLNQDLIQYNDRKGNIEALTARKLLFFEIFDTTVKQYRQFYALPYNSNTGYKAPVFFELLAEGKMTLLTRESLEYRTYSSPYYYGASYSRLVLVYHYYLLKENGDIETFSGKKSDLLLMMGKKADLVQAYMHDNKLQVDNKPELTQIVTYYNSLF